jgi:hypothetical protein
MIEEERHHLNWVKEWLDRQAGIRGEVVERTIAEFRAVDARVYQALLVEFSWARTPELDGESGGVGVTGGRIVGNREPHGSRGNAHFGREGSALQ